MKKKTLALALAVLLLAIMVSGTLAYFTAESEVTNTFTIGSVDIQIYENFEEKDALVPVVTVDENDPNYITKEAWVKNTGKNPAYVQAYVAIPKALDDVGAFVVVDADSSDWDDREFVGVETIGEVSYNVYRYLYNKELAVGATTENVIKAAYMAPELDYKDGKFVMDGTVINDYTPGEAINIYVAAQAIQSEGFADYESALGSFTTNPWA